MLHSNSATWIRSGVVGNMRDPHSLARGSIPRFGIFFYFCNAKQLQLPQKTKKFKKITRTEGIEPSTF